MGGALRKFGVFALAGLVAAGGSLKAGDGRWALQATPAWAAGNCPIGVSSDACLPPGPDRQCPPGYGFIPDSRTGPVCAANPAPPDQGGGGQHHHGGGSWLGPLIIGGGALVGGLLLSHGHGEAAEQPRPPTAEELLANGPQIFEVRPVNAYPVYGFIQDGWPIVVDYSSPPGAQTVLKVVVGDHAWSRTLEAAAHPVVVRFDGGFAPNPSVALLTVESTAGEGPGHLEVYGIGAGPRAVGGLLSYAPNPRAVLLLATSSSRPSAGERAHPAALYRIAANEGAAGSLPIDILAFGPPILVGGKGVATFSYRRNMPFENISPEVIRTTRPKPNSIKSEIVWRDQIQRRQGPGLSGDRTWDGRVREGGKVSLGLHRLQVRAWQQDATQPDWGGVPSRQEIEVH